MVEHTVSGMESGKKVHRVLRQLLPGVPLSGIYKMLRTGRVKRNGKKAKAEDTVAAGDILRLFMAEEDFLEVSKPAKKFGGVPRELDIVYEDDELLAVNKPVGLLTHGTVEELKDTLVNRVLAYLYDRGALETTTFTPAPANRLDRNTSGLVLFGKSGDAARELAAGLQNHDIRKWYLAIVKGVPDEQGDIRARLARPEGQNRTVVSHSGKEAATLYRRLATTGRTSLVRIELLSGRTHQIRAHFAHIGHPLWDDVKYGALGQGFEGEGHHQWLHAGWVQLKNGQLLFAPIPSEYAQTLRMLGYTERMVADIARI